MENFATIVNRSKQLLLQSFPSQLFVRVLDTPLRLKYLPNLFKHLPLISVKYKHRIFFAGIHTKGQIKDNKNRREILESDKSKEENNCLIL